MTACSPIAPAPFDEGGASTQAYNINSDYLRAELQLVKQGKPSNRAKNIAARLPADLKKKMIAWDFSTGGSASLADADFVKFLRTAAIEGKIPPGAKPAQATSGGDLEGPGYVVQAPSKCPDPVIGGGAELVFFTAKNVLNEIASAKNCSVFPASQQEFCASVMADSMQDALGIKPESVLDLVDATPNSVEAGIAEHDRCVKAEVAKQCDGTYEVIDPKNPCGSLQVGNEIYTVSNGTVSPLLDVYEYDPVACRMSMSKASWIKVHGADEPCLPQVSDEPIFVDFKTLTAKNGYGNSGLSCKCYQEIPTTVKKK